MNFAQKTSWWSHSGHQLLGNTKTVDLWSECVATKKNAKKIAKAKISSGWWF